MVLFLRPATYQPTVVIDAVELRSWPEHDAIYQSSAFPYVLRLERGPAKMLYIGVRHTSEAADPQLAEIERLWAEFQPTVALCEGRARMFRFASRPATGTLHESELVHILARRGRTTLLARAGVRGGGQWPAAAIRAATRRDLPDASGLHRRSSGVRRRPRRARAASAAQTYRRRRAPWLSLSVQDLDTYWRERFPTTPDWRTLSDTESVPLLVEVGHAFREVRGEHMIRTLVDLARRGERVLAVVGASHVIPQELALGKAFEKALAQSAAGSG